MKRDNDLIRELLLEMEAANDFRFDPHDSLSNSDVEKRIYHMKLLEDHGYVTAAGKYHIRLTSAGHDFIDAMRDEGIWKKTKDAVARAGGNATLDIIKEIATAFLKKQFMDGFDL